MKQAISTSVEQSRRLLACGVDPNTADMCWTQRTHRIDGSSIKKSHQKANLWLGYPCKRFLEDNEQRIDTPAWSLSALCSILPNRIKANNACLTIVADYNDWNVGYEYDSLIGRGIENVKSFSSHGLIEACVQMIEWLLANGYSLDDKEI